MNDMTATEVLRREREVMPKLVAKLVVQIKALDDNFQEDMVKIMEECLIKVGIKL